MSIHIKKKDISKLPQGKLEVLFKQVFEKSSQIDDITSDWIITEVLTRDKRKLRAKDSESRLLRAEINRCTKILKSYSNVMSQ